MGIGDRIRSARDRAGLTQRGLAALVDCNAFQVSRWERGAASPRADTCAKLAEALRVSADWLIGRPADSTPATGTEG